MSQEIGDVDSRDCVEVFMPHPVRAVVKSDRLRIRLTACMGYNGCSFLNRR